MEAERKQRKGGMRAEKGGGKRECVQRWKEEIKEEMREINNVFTIQCKHKAIEQER